MQATRITAIRHGETDWNVATRLQGHTDITLNAHGLWQAEQVAQALADEPIDAVYSSDLSRAYATAQAILQANPNASQGQVQIDKRLRERCFGEFEGQTYHAIETQWPQAWRRWRAHDADFAPPGGETPEQLRARVTAALDSIAARHLSKHIVLVAHGGVLDALYRIATQQATGTPRNWELRNATLNRLLWTPDTLSLVGWGDARHLDDAVVGEGLF